MDYFFGLSLSIIAFSISVRQYFALKNIINLISTIEKIDSEDTLKFSLNKEFLKNISFINLPTMNFNINFADIIFKSPQFIANDIIANKQSIIKFLNKKHYSDYFSINSELLENLLSNHNSRSAKIDFITKYIFENNRIAAMNESARLYGFYSLDEDKEDELLELLQKLEEIIPKLDESQLDSLVGGFILKTKKDLISYVLSIKDKYIEYNLITSLKVSGIAFGIIYLIYLIFVKN